MIAVNPLMILPFALLLAAIALAPLLAAKLWSRHYAKISFSLGATTLFYYLFVLHDSMRVCQVGRDYISFIVLIGSLYVVSGGIHIAVKGEATPFANVIFLLFGAVIANILGTTGASMLLIRPWIRMNKYRVTAHHIVFFIFIIANAGGCLLPTGPPLFLGYLQGVPFWWTAQHCGPMWMMGVGMLLATFYAADRINFARARREIREQETARETWKCEGLANLFYTAVILAAVFVDKPIFLREAIMLTAAFASYFTTKKSIHEANHFDFHPITEVAVLFAGIFATMIPALDWLSSHAETMLGRDPAPGIFFWGAGSLSATLDNAPAYLAFLSALFGATGAGNIRDL
ncbi:MAG: sodium:proton antiporter, partial [Limisphaerales bacterium]